jgi:hypothetical protein
MRALVYEGIDLGDDDTSLIADFLDHNIVPWTGSRRPCWRGTSPCLESRRRLASS